MLSEDVYKVFYDLVPSQLDIHGTLTSLNKTLGDLPLNEIECPTVNVSIIDGEQYFRSFDDMGSEDDVYISFTQIESAIVRYTVGATDITRTVTETIRISSGQTTYKLHSPIIKINSIQGHASTDYKIDSDSSSVVWLHNMPAAGSTFTINYTWIDNGYWVARAIMSRLINFIKGEFSYRISEYDVNILNVDKIEDLSRLYANKSLRIFAVDVTITYPFNWTIDKSLLNGDDYGPTLLWIKCPVYEDVSQTTYE